MKKQLSIEHLILIILCTIIALLSVANAIYHAICFGVGMIDYTWIWKECALALRGYDVAEIARQHISIPEIGALHASRSASAPWAKIIGNVIHPGFLNERASKLYGVIFYLFVIVWTWAKLIPYLYENNSFSKRYINIISILFTIMPIYWAFEIGCWNNGLVLGYLAFLSVLYAEDNQEIFAGFLLALASIKPQISALFFIALFLRKKIKTILSSTIMLISSWGIYCLVSHVNPVADLFIFLGLSDNNSENYWWYGWFDFLTDLGVKSSLAMTFSMVMGIILCIIGCLIVLKRKSNATILYYSIPTILSFFWSYKTVSDFLVVSTSNTLVLFLLNNQTRKKRNSIFCFLYLGIMNVNVFSGIFRRLFDYSWRIGMTIDSWVRLAFFIIMGCLILQNNDYCDTH